MQADWRPILGLTDDLQGTLVERVLAVTVLTEAVAQHNKDIDKARSGK